MPTYEYRCPEGHQFERVQKMTGPPRAKCPSCGRTATRLISGGAGLIFKGSGFYITDYGKDGKGPRVDEAEAKPEAATAKVEDTSAKAEPTANAEKTEKTDKPEKSEKKSSKKKASS